MYPVVAQTPLCDTDILQRYVKCISETLRPCISDILLHKWIICASMSAVCNTMDAVNCVRIDASETEMNTSRLTTLLQKSAVEHLTTCREFEARQFASEVAIVTTDFEALYAYKHGDHQRCLQLSTQNVHALLYGSINEVSLIDVPVLPPFIELFDDDIVSLTALKPIVNLNKESLDDIFISQLTLSLYLMTQCQLKLRHSLTSLAKTLDYIELAQRRHRVHRTLDQLTLKLAERKILMYMYSTMTMNN